MKKINLITTAMLFSLPVFSNDFVIVIENNSANEYFYGDYLDTNETSDWEIVSTTCSYDKETDDVYYQTNFIQTETCIENIERTVKITRTYEDGSSEIISNETETDQNTYQYTNTLEGTYISDSCKDILDKGFSTGNGVYTINNSKYYDVYCDMTTNDGGWTLVFAQYEDNPITDWNEGIQSDYDPSLSSSVSFVLNSSEIPTHSEISFGQTDTNGISASSNYFDYTYTTSNIALTQITEKNSNDVYNIHRSEIEYYSHHDPDYNTLRTLSDSNLEDWKNTITIDKDNISEWEYSFAFSPFHEYEYRRCFSYNGYLIYDTYENGAWTLWVR